MIILVIFLILRTNFSNSSEGLTVRSQKCSPFFPTTKSLSGFRNLPHDGNLLSDCKSFALRLFQPGLVCHDTLTKFYQCIKIIMMATLTRSSHVVLLQFCEQMFKVTMQLVTIVVVENDSTLHHFSFFTFQEFREAFKRTCTWPWP